MARRSTRTSTARHRVVSHQDWIAARTALLRKEKVFKAKAGAMFHTYSTYARGIDMVNGTYQFLDLAPKGRDEGSDFPQEWVRHHDRYPREKRRGRRH
jgi:predicted dithiol-disulfide oxidoreductase (DUF899 family)